MSTASLPSNILKSILKSLTTRVSWAGTAAIMLTLLLTFTARLKAQTYIPIIYPGAVVTEAHGINAFGQIVGSWQDASGNTHGFLYNAGIYTSFDFPGSSQTTPYAINNAGDIVGDHDASVGFLLKEGVFTTLPSANGWDVNNFDFIATGAGYLDSSLEADVINVPGSLYTLSRGINDAAQITGTYSDGTRTHGFLFNQISYSTIDVPGQADTWGNGINTAGEIVGYYYDTLSVQHGFLYDGAAFIPFDYPGSTNETYAYRVNDFGQVVGRTFVPANGYIGFLRTPAGLNPVPHIHQALFPASSAPGSAGFTLTVEGTGFVQGAEVLWNGSPVPTSFQSAKKLTATISASDVAAEGTALITVANPTPGGGTSNTQFFSITSPVQTPSFTVSTVTAGSSPQRNIAADFNRDGIMDLAAADGPNDRVWVALGNGDGTFQSPVPYTVGQGPSTLIAADFDNDGKLDIAVGDSDGGIYVLQGNGDGSFHLDPILSVAGAGPWDLAVGDFNGDGKLDLACVNQSGNTISIFLGNGDAIFNGDGFFQPPAAVATNANPGQMAVGDFNGDGILDMAVANFGSFSGNTVSVFLGKGNGTFQPKVDYTVSLAPLSLVTADFNGDGKLDLAVANSCGTSSPCGRPGLVSILLGNGDGTFKAHVDYPAGSFPYTIVVGDFNGDGNLDVAVSDLDSSQVTILSGAGDGTFPNSTAVSTDGSPVGLLAADFNRDGEMDLAAGSGSAISILLQNVPVQSLASLSLSPATVLGGSIANGTVTLSGPAPSGGTNIDLSSSNPAAATVPGSVSIPAGVTTAAFTVVSVPVAADTSLTISATSGSSTQTAALTVQAPALASLKLTPATLIGGSSSVATATLNGPAPSSGVSIAVSSNNPSIAAPTSNITVAGGSSSGTATVTTQGVATSTPVKISATLRTVTKAATLTVKPVALLSVKLSPASLYGGATSTATVTLNGEAPAAGAVIALATSNTSIASLPATVTVPGGTTSAAVTVQTEPVSPTTAVTISAAYGGLTRTANLTVKAPILSAITLSPTSVTGGSPSTATVKLNNPAPAGGAVVALASSNPSAAAVPASVTVPAGATTATVTVTTNPVLLRTTVHISANYSGATKSATLTVR
jgi:probable HAF family extracellular repeat protein